MKIKLLALALLMTSVAGVGILSGCSAPAEKPAAEEATTEEAAPAAEGEAAAPAAEAEKPAAEGEAAAPAAEAEKPAAEEHAAEGEKH